MQSKFDSGPPLLPRQTAPLPSRLRSRRRLSLVLGDGFAGYHFSKGYGRDDGDG